MCASYLTQLAGLDRMYLEPTTQPCFSPSLSSSSSLLSSPLLSGNTHRTFEPSQLFHDWCWHNEYIPTAFITTYYFLRELKLCVFPGDPLEYPGLSHAVSLLTTDHQTFEQLSRRDQAKITFSLDKVYSDHYITNFFDVNQTVGHRWRISSTLADAEGFFNRGVHMVTDMECSSASAPCILKVLSSEATYTGYAEREIAILYALRDHPNIVQIKDAYMPYQRHVAPWVCMEQCNAGTLKACMAKNLTTTKCAPELFIWHVFESLVEAVRFCHCGPAGKRAMWDPIFHRDIIPGNILLHQDVKDEDNYPWVKLADFGCAVTESEVAEKGLRPGDLPEEDPGAVPSEGAVASEAADIFQIGLVIDELVSNELWLGGRRSAKLMCSFDLRYFVDICLSDDPVERPRAAVLLEALQDRRTFLKDRGVLRYRKLVS
jgi:serine/threonine protein kinase